MSDLNSTKTTEISYAEYETLIALAHSLKGHNWAIKKSPKHWKGIRCRGGHVISISLPNRKLTGTLPDLSALSHLELLQLHHNQLTGLLPPLNHFNHLKVLTLHHNQLSGTLPNLSALTQLKILVLDNNQLNGPLPSVKCLVNLERLSMGHNQFTGTLPDLTTLSHLKILSLPNNQLNGHIPSLNSLTRLQWLHLEHNQLSSSIPELEHLINLKHLYLNHNHLSGPIPALKSLTRLERLYLNNNQLSGQIPALNPLNRLEHLCLSHNHLSGTIPDITPLPHLEHLLLNHNELIGNIPDLFQNEHDDRLKLKWLYLDNNQLTGVIPDLKVLPNLRGLSLHNNQLCGTMPDFSLPIDRYSGDERNHLEWISLHNNQLSGTIPLCLTLLKNLTHLSIDNNHLTAKDKTVIEFLYHLNPTWEKTQTPQKTNFMEYATRYQTRRGDKVHSQSEVIIADLLYQKGINYKYEMPLIAKGQIYYPSFTFKDEELGLIFYWEHLRRFAQPQSRQEWKNQLIWYRQQQILPYEHGGGKMGTLIATQDDKYGYIHPPKVERLIDEILVSVKQIKQHLKEKKANLFSLLQTAILLYKRK
jgi:Leucine-rich repeat (LRR) protein